MDFNPKAPFDLDSEPSPPPEPVPFQVDYPRTEPPILKRLPWAIYIFVFLIGFIMVNQLSRAGKPGTGSKDDSMQEMSIEMIVATRGLSKTNSDQKVFEPQIDELVKEAKTNPHAQKMRVALRVEDGDKPFTADLANLAKSKKAEDRAFAELYSAEKLDKKQTEALISKMTVDSLPERIAKVQALEKVGDKNVRSKVFNAQKFMPLLMLGGSLILLLPLGFAAWIYYYSARGKGNLKPLGHPYLGMNLAIADRLFFAGICVIGTYLGASAVAAAISYKTGMPGLEFFSYGTIFVTIWLLFTRPIYGWKISLTELGLKGHSPEKSLGWAFGAWVANVPILLLVVMISAVLSRYLPPSSHPASEELLKGPGASDVLKVFFFASIVAPIWEEVLFRGFLFPAFSAVAKNPMWGALLSSLCFSLIHPQGLLGALPLTAIAMMMCAVTYQTRSLVPGIILHSIHNAATLAVALAVGYAL